MKHRPKLNRAASPEEVAVVRAALERVAAAPEFRRLTTSLEQLRVVSKCGCGCDSVDFADYDPGHPTRVIAQGTGTSAVGSLVGVMVWGTAESVTGLEVYDLGECLDSADARLPVPSSIRGIRDGAA